MPLKLRQLKAVLRHSGFASRPDKGSHSIWTHPKRPTIRLVLSSSNGSGAKPYQMTRVRQQFTPQGENRRE